MRIMKCMLISFIVVNLASQGLISSVLSADMAGKSNRLKINLDIHDMFKQAEPGEFILKAKPLTVNEQVFLKGVESKTQGLQDQAAGAYYSNERNTSANKSPMIEHPFPGDLVDGAVIGAFIGWLASSGKDLVSIRKSTRIGALCGTIFITLVYVF